ncbi:threonine-phosphate decarboxylase CobD [Rhizobium sp. EC-SD404]|uniref:threonine-phosphate decarboxylase CobD n=1 Tax=Rhizobium sp. EC-SD404 TaxID=2038389 RepID=UPI00125159AF|nr:threonine-phosphate decarboxylase CobD [Rhizobium sp. EC-SD404]VVT25326.1 Threonine-phosphate decarboxylase [Rhizobium sp. EC-SD404]
MSALPRHGGGLAAACRLFGGQPRDWLDLSTGINPLAARFTGPGEDIWQRLPDADLTASARAAAALHYGVPDDHPQPLPVPGTQAAIQTLPRLLVGGRRVVIAAPTYNEYARVFRAAGCQVDELPADDALGADADAIIVVNPNNPDGRLLSRADILAAADRLAARGGTLVVDEAFADCDPRESVAGDAGAHQSLIVLRSFGKFFGLAGLRLGFVIAQEARLSAIEAMMGPWPVSGPALAVAAEIMADRGQIEAMRQAIGERNRETRNVLEQAGLHVVGDGGLFLLVQHPAAADIYDHLCRDHVLVRAFDYRRDWLRFGLTKDASEAERLADVLSKCPAMSKS